MVSMKISVIVPVYNVKNYLEKCIESILSQSFTNIELILVDDGSTDGSGELCDRYTFDERVIVIHKPNGGVSAARNVGIDKATGDYICFIDSDDFIEKDYFQVAVNYLEKNNIGVLINNYCSDLGNGNVIYYNANNMLLTMSSFDAILSMVKGRLFNWSSFATFYKNDIVKKVKFDEGIVYTEDLIYKYNILKVCKDEIMYVPLNKYHYVMRKCSAVRSYSIHKKKDCLKAFKYVMEKEDNEIANVLINKQYLPQLIRFHRDSILQDGDTDLEREFKEEILSVLKNNLFSSNIKIKLKLKMLRSLLPRIVLKMYYK